MATLRIVSGPALLLMRERIAAARILMAQMVPATLALVGATCAQALTDAAPRGEESGENPPGDAPGPLAESFTSELEMRGTYAGVVRVKTTQPTKLRYVRRGTGVYGPNGQRIRPLVKKALYWKNAPHPMKSVAGQRANDFVTPVVNEATQSADDRLAELAVRLVETVEGSAAP